MRIYLAGPEVFLPDAEAVAAAKKEICARHGAVGVFPTDLHADHAETADMPRWYSIYLRNEAHLRDSDGLIANLTPFRGPSADAGAVYELGFMRALGRPVAGYTNDGALFLPRTLRALGPEGARRAADGRWYDAEGLAIEDFGLVDNLMIDGGIRAAGGVLTVADRSGADRWRDLAAFTACVRHLTRRAPRPPVDVHSPG